MSAINKPRLLFFLLLNTSVLLSSLLPICRSLESDHQNGVGEETEDEHEFVYVEGSGKGPDEWGEIKSDWKACDNGEMQSPIDLVNNRVQIMPTLGRLKRNYKQAPAILKNRGHDIMVKWKGDAGSININNTDYSLKQSHWHSPSEHTFNGSRHELELHLVHESDCGKMAVVAITYKYGRPDPFLEKIIHHIHSSVVKEERDVGIINPGNVKFGSRKYYRYLGSLTVPPCTEGVIWTIVKKVRTASREQVRTLREAVDDDCEVNARPVQHKEKRTVWLYSPHVTGAPS
ncbi:Alpha carbonic anhydrase [Macleaya cordata]|uniref:Alpha carbonic anhydrase n=1 Tax=Macleaya cordata TaxID=56857 RepID=A0A200QA23_MACCD|nr:Alpha carbonic anhydrase [Macleaya cordata]